MTFLVRLQLLLFLFCSVVFRFRPWSLGSFGISFADFFHFLVGLGERLLLITLLIISSKVDGANELCMEDVSELLFNVSRNEL